MKNLIVILNIAFLFKNSNAIETQVVQTYCDSSNIICSELENSAAQKAKANAATKFFKISQIAAENQSQICKDQISNMYQPNCNNDKFKSLTEQIEQIKIEIEKKSSNVTQNKIAIDANVPKSDTESISQIVSNLEKLVSEIKELQAQLDPLKVDLDKLNQTCELQYDLVKQVCQPPEAVSMGGETLIVQRKITGNQSSIIKTEVPNGEGQTGAAEAVAKVEASGEVPAPQIESTVQSFERSYYNTSLTGGQTNKTFDDTNALALAAIEAASSTARSLSSLSGNQVSGELEDPFADTETPLGSSPRPEARPQTAGTPSNKTSGNGNGGAGNNESVSGDQLAMDVQNSAYGAPTGPAAGATPAAGNGGGLSGALSSLTSLFGKTGGSNSFGDDSSYGSNSYGSSRYGSRGSGGSYNAPSDSYDYSQNNNPNLKINPNARPGTPAAFTGAPGGNANFAGGGQGGGAGVGLSGQGGSGAGLPKDEKPSFLSKLLGKKDFSLFGKSTSSGGGGKFKSSSSSSSGSGKLGENQYIDPKTGEIKTRLFDPAKYKPSKSAEERAYLRSTGRKVAAYNPGSADFQWPNDISKDKQLNMFRTVNLVHKTKLSK